MRTSASAQREYVLKLLGFYSQALLEFWARGLRIARLGPARTSREQHRSRHLARIVCGHSCEG